MKSYKDLMQELLEDEKFREIHFKKEALHHFLDEIVKDEKKKGKFIEALNLL
ncbi:MULTISPECIES: hypothetical protein [Marinitoga]|uniref:hypothetical protein n=1 Tax=Marinitoga TaxID=160798 RepID=UPI0002EB89A8|nr:MULTISPECIES: hypothetical protein [Marinitoga]